MRKIKVTAMAIAIVLLLSSVMMSAVACDEGEKVVFAKIIDDNIQLATEKPYQPKCDNVIYENEGDIAMICMSVESYESVREGIQGIGDIKEYDSKFFDDSAVVILMGLCPFSSALEVDYYGVKDSVLELEISGLFDENMRQKQYFIVLQMPKQDLTAVKTLSVAKNAPQALAELKTSARQDCLEKFVLPEHADATIEDVTLAPFLGVFDGAIAAVFYYGQYHGVWPDVLEETIIGDVTFSWPAGYPIEVWKDGEIYTLSEAYEKEIISAENLAEINNNYILLRR